jgi:hypothetical protein
VISAAENSNKFQKTRFWKEKSVEDLVTLGPRALVFSKTAADGSESRNHAFYFLILYTH